MVLHRALEREGYLSRDFSLEYRWTKDGEETKRTMPQFTVSFTCLYKALRVFKKDHCFLSERTTLRKRLRVSMQPNKIKKVRGLNQKSWRQDWRCWDPFEGSSQSLARVAARIKEGRLTARSMAGREGDHHAGWGGQALCQE